MPQLTHISFVYDQSRYTLDINAEESEQDETLSFNVAATRETDDADPLTVTSDVVIRPSERIITAVLGDRDFKFDGFEDIPLVEKVIDEIPVELADPILGCAIKSGVSTIIGQGIHCFRGLEKSGAWRVFREFLNCMKNRAGAITISAGAKTFRCMMRIAIGGL